MPIRHHTSKLYQIEKIVKEKFENINFQIIFLNVSSKGTFVNFILKDKKNFDRLGIVPVRETNSFTVSLDAIGGNNIPHREIFPKASLNDFDIGINTLNVINDVILKFCPAFYCIGIDCYDGKLNYDNVHLELYPEKNIVSLENHINILKTHGINTGPFEKYFLNFKKFSHVKFRIDNGEVKNIKYYRSINVNIPEFYYG